MFDIGWSELLLIAIVALIVVGPKDLPGMFRTLGRFTAKMRAMARDFQRAMNEAADEAGVGEINKVAGDLRKATSPTRLGLDRLNEAADRFEKWDPKAALKKGGKEGAAKAVPGESAAAPAGSAAGRLSEERAEVARRIREHAAEVARKRIAEETAAASGTPPAKAPAAGGSPADGAAEGDTSRDDAK